MQLFRFGDFELDLSAFELRRSGKVIRLERRPFDLLALLVRQPQRLVPRAEIIAALWPPNVIIDFESGLNTIVRKVRTALGDSSEIPKFIETVPGRGYRFIAQVVVVSGPLPIGQAEGEKRLSRAWRPSRFAASISLLLVAVVVSLAWLSIDQDTGPSRIAILPFENLTGDDELDYLAAGIAEDTSTTLAQIDPLNLRVIGVSTSALTKSPLSVADIGRRLGVDFVVLSSLRLEGTRIRVTSRLLRVADGEQLWAAPLDREVMNLLGLQRELSVAIAEQIRLRLSPEVAAAIDRRQTQNPAAYALYLKGRYEWGQLSPASIRRAMQYFEQATDQDPEYALAWAGIAFASIGSVRTADADPRVAGPVAGDALSRALRLGPDLAETQYAKGYYSLFGELDPRAAAEAARLAIELDPNNAHAHMLLGMSLLQLGDYLEASEVMRRSRELDPLFALAFANSANLALVAGNPGEALEFASQAVAINPEFWVGHYYVGGARLQLGDLDGALQAFSDAARYSNEHSLTYAARADVLVRLGRRDEAQALLAELTTRATQRYVPAYALAVVHAVLGDGDSALESLNLAVESHDVNLPSLPRDNRLQSLHDDPRFGALLDRCGCVMDASEPR